MKSLALFAMSIFVAALSTVNGAAQAAIVGISIPVNSSDAISHPNTDNVWSVGVPPAPFNVNSGIGFLINLTFAGPGSAQNASDFTLHDHVPASGNVPDPSRAVVTFRFDTSTIVKGVLVIQHQNGISQIEGFAGNALNSLPSLGAVFGPSGDVTGSSQFTEFGAQVFDFANSNVSGGLFQLVVRKTSASGGYASYRIFPLDVNGIPIPAATTAVPLPGSFWLLGPALCGVGLARRCAV